MFNLMTLTLALFSEMKEMVTTSSVVNNKYAFLE